MNEFNLVNAFFAMCVWPLCLMICFAVIYGLLHLLDRLN